MTHQRRMDTPEPLFKAIQQFNAGQYYECHETLEDLWRAEPGSIRDLYKGIIQIAVAIYHAQRANLKGARRLVSSGMDLIKPFIPVSLGVDTALLMEQTARLQAAIESLPPGQSLPAKIFPTIRLIRGSSAG